MAVLIRFVHNYWRAETRALIARMSTEPARALGDKIDTLLGHLLDDGFLARMDTLYVPWKMHAQQAALLDWKRPTGAATLHGLATWDTAYGFVGNTGTGSYIDSNFTPSTEASNFTANNGGIGGYITALPTTNKALWGTYGSSSANQRCVVYFTTSPNNNSFTNASVSGDSGLVAGALQNTAAGTATTGLIQHNRTTSSSQELFMNGSSIGTNTYSNASRALSTHTVYLAAENGNGTLLSNGATKLGAWWMGDDFTPAEQTTMKGYFDAYAA